MFVIKEKGIEALLFATFWLFQLTRPVEWLIDLISLSYQSEAEFDM